VDAHIAGSKAQAAAVGQEIELQLGSSPDKVQRPENIRCRGSAEEDTFTWSSDTWTEYTLFNENPATTVHSP